MRLEGTFVGSLVMSTILILVMISQVYAHIKTYQIAF